MDARKPLPSGLSVADLMANLPCNWFVLSKVKRGPGVFYACTFCAEISKTKTCAMERRPA